MTLICILHTLVPVCYVCFPTPTINDLPWIVCLVCLRIDLSKTTRRSPKACFCFVLLFSFVRGSFSSSSTLSSVQSISCHLSRTEINQQHINIHYPIPSCVSKRRGTSVVVGKIFRIRLMEYFVTIALNRCPRKLRTM